MQMEYTLACGCISRWSTLEEQYLVEHTCDRTVLRQAQRAERRARIAQSREQEDKMLRARLNGDRAFKLMR